MDLVVCHQELSLPAPERQVEKGSQPRAGPPWLADLLASRSRARNSSSRSSSATQSMVRVVVSRGLVDARAVSA